MAVQLADSKLTVRRSLHAASLMLAHRTTSTTHHGTESLFQRKRIRKIGYGSYHFGSPVIRACFVPRTGTASLLFSGHMVAETSLRRARAFCADTKLRCLTSLTQSQCAQLETFMSGNTPDRSHCIKRHSQEDCEARL